MKLPPVLFLVGADRFQIRLILEEIRGTLFPEGSSGLNDDAFDLKERSLAELFDLANTLPMLASHRLIVAADAGAPSDEEQERWLAYLGNPAPRTVLVVTAEKLDKRLKLARALDRLGYFREVAPPKPRDLPGWVARIAKRRGVSLTPIAAAALADAIGTDLARIDQETEKLALYAHPEKTVTEGAVRELVEKTTGENVFAFADEIFEGRLGQALGTLNHLLGEGQPALVLVSMLARHVRILMKARYHSHAGTPRPQLGAALGIPPFLVERYITASRRLGEPALRESLAELARLDRALKSTGHPPHLLLERSARKLARLARS